MKFINNSFEKNVNDTITLIFPNLIINERNLLKYYTLNIIEYISCRFCFDLNNKNLYYDQFYQNNYRDIKSIIVLLLPFIDDKNGTYELHKQIYTLTDIAKSNITNINKDRSLNEDTIYKFSKQDIEVNYNLILDTLNVTSNKLYINWLNCLPYTLTNYKKSLLWDSSYKFDEQNNNFNFNNVRNDFDYNGLHIYDIYNCCNQFLFQHILPTKWLLYEKLLEFNKKPVMYIDEINKFFSLDLLLNKKKWELLSIEEKTNISTKWYRLLSSAKKAKEISTSPQSLINKFHLGIVKNIILHFESYNNKYEIFTPKIYNEEEKEKKIIVNNDYSVNTVEKILTANEFIKLIDDKYKIDIIYNYLIISINEFNKTWFGKKILKDNKINYLDIKLQNIQGKEFYLTYKNIYNFAKSLCYNNYKYITEARCLSDDDLKEFITKINEDIILSNVLKMTYQDVYNNIGQYLKEISKNISLEIKKILMEIVFESHIIYGLLSKFTPIKEVTDNNYKSNITKNIQTIIFNDNNIKDFKNSYYFLTNDKYNKLTCYDNKNNKTINYIDLLKEDNSMHWFTPFALDWIYQIQFNHRFLNNRLIYVTGATGQGKSTQVPKLLYYATKAFCLEMNPKVISTQPRINPTIANAKRIAIEMGVPIEINENVNTFIDYIQYSTSLEKHNYGNNTYIREVIDKILYNDMLSDPLLDNKYNVIIVDEAHEHNINMDLILTLMKSTLYFNNKIRFIITSATIDYDEPRYREYYRNIDDNLLFPCNRQLLDNNLDRIVIDRRTHISPPGETTRFKVTENWEDKDPISYEQAEKIGIKRAIEIAQKNNGQGDILFFSIGQTEIKRICNQLNENLPTHAIALPYYSELPEAWKIIAIEPDSRENKLNFDKTKLFDVIVGNIIDYERKNYTTFIIVATNVAEASITIKNLKFVIDTGYSKSMPFDIINNKKDTKILPITNMNRLQRKGRVGRKSDGEVYYTYSMSFLDNNKPNYNIQNSDFTIFILNFLTSKEDYICLKKQIREDKLLEIKINQENLIQKTIKNYNQYEKFEDFKININNKYKTFFRTYYKKDEDNLFNPQGLTNIRNYDVLKVPRRYIDGKFSIEDIFDEDKNFYLIHPNNIYLYFQNCIIKKYILETSDNEVLYIINKHIEKILKILPNFSSIFGYEENYTIPIINTLIHSIKYDCMNDVIKILIWLHIIKIEQNKINKIYNKGKEIKIKSMYSDLLVLLDLDKTFIFDPEIKIEDLRPDKIKLQIFIDWFNNTDDNKWFNISEDLKKNNTYKKYYNFLFNKNTELGTLQFNKIIPNPNSIIKENLIQKYVNNYKTLTFLFNEELFDNELLNNHLFIDGYKKIKEIAEELQINRTSNHIHNILKSFFSGYNSNILDCNRNKWKSLYYDKEFIPHKQHFLDNINGLYFAIDYIINNDILQPIFLSKILDNNWIDEIL